jgi:tetratricopeptide (TPR) repeat protein
VRQRHAEYFRRFAEEQIQKVRTAGEAAALQQFDADDENVQAATAWCRQEQKDELCAALALALGIFYERRGFQHRALQQIQVGLDAAQRLPGPPTILRARLLREFASLCVDQDLLSAARRCASEALALFSELGDVRGKADASNLLGLADFKEGDLPPARDHFTSALKEFEQIGDPLGIAAIHNQLGLVEYTDETGNKEEAAHHFEEVLRLSRANGDQRGIAAASCNLGMLALQQGSLEEAWQYYHEALRTARGLWDEYGVGRELSNLGEVAELKGELALACRLFAAAERLFTSVGAPEAQYSADLFSAVAARLEVAEAGVAALRQSANGKSLEELIDWALTGEETPDACAQG